MIPALVHMTVTFNIQQQQLRKITPKINVLFNNRQLLCSSLINLIEESLMWLQMAEGIRISYIHVG